MKHRVFPLLFAAVFATTIGLSIIEPLMALYAESLGATGLFIGLIFASFTIARALSTPLVGKASDKHGRKPFIVGGLAMYTLSSFLYLWANDVNTLIMVRLFQGVTSAFVAPIAFAYVGDIAPKGQEGKYMGTFTMAMFLGLGIGPVIGGVLNHYFSIHAAFVTMGLLGLASLIGVAALLPELKLHRKTKPTRIRDIIKDSNIQLVLFMRLISAFGVAGFIVFLPLYAADMGLNTAQIGTIVTLNLLMTTLPQRFFGKIADKHKKVPMIVAGNLILGLTILAIPLTWNFASLLALNLLMGLGGAVTIPANTALAVQFGRKHGMGSALGLLQTAFAVGLTAGPLLAGIVLDNFGLPIVFVATSTLVISGTLSFFAISKRNKHKLDSITF